MGFHTAKHYDGFWIRVVLPNHYPTLQKTDSGCSDHILFRPFTKPNPGVKTYSDPTLQKTEYGSSGHFRIRPFRKPNPVIQTISLSDPPENRPVTPTISGSDPLEKRDPDSYTPA